MVFKGPSNPDYSIILRLKAWLQEVSANIKVLIYGSNTPHLYMELFLQYLLTTLFLRCVFCETVQFLV